jgi:polyisoprenoid-binding protein YceI
VTASFKILRWGTVLLALLLAGCPPHPVRPGKPPGEAVPAAGTRPTPHLGRPYDVVGSESVLRVLVYRGGALAKAGHNHVIASHDLSGTIYVPEDATGATFEIKMPLADLTVDEASLRAQEGGDFSAEVPDSAREGTRRNMLGQALLNAQLFPEIVLRSERIERNANGGLEAHVQAEVRQAPHSIVVPFQYEMQAGQLSVSGELPLRQTDLGLTPFTALLGALQVEDQMRVKFHFVARPAPTSSGGKR